MRSGNAALCPEEGKRHACLQRRPARLSMPCRPMREKFARMKESMQQPRTACEADRRFVGKSLLVVAGWSTCLSPTPSPLSDQCFQLLPKRGRLFIESGPPLPLRGSGRQAMEHKARCWSWSMVQASAALLVWSRRRNRIVMPATRRHLHGGVAVLLAPVGR